MRFFAIASVLFIAAASVFASPVVQRDNAQSAAAILTDLNYKVTPLAHQLRYATHENATEENLKPIINEIGACVTNAVSNLNHLSGKSNDVILASADGAVILGPSDIAELLGGIVCLILQAAEAVLKVADSAIYTIICDLLTALGKIVCNLISVLLPLVTGLLTPLLALLAPILSIVSDLGLTGLLASVLGVVL